MPKKTATVDEFLEDLDHPFKDEVLRLRQIILGADDGITEQIKWNAPSFCYQGDDRITFRLHPPKAVQLIFHRGAKVKDSSDFQFEDSSGLLNWVSADRATLTLSSMEDVEEHADAIARLAREWMHATTE